MKWGRGTHDAKLKLSSAVAIALALGVSTAHSEENTSSPWQISLSTGTQTENLPTFDAPVGDTFVVGYPGLISEKFNPTLRGGEGNIGYTTRSGWNIELGGGYWTGDDSTSAQPVYDVNTNAYSLAVSGGDGVSGVLLGTSVLEGDRVYASVDASLSEAHIRLARDVKADGIIVHPFMGLIYERSSHDYTASFRLAEPQVGNLEIPYAYSQGIVSSRLGGDVGVKFTVPLDENLQFHASAAFALFHQASDMSARDCVARAQFSPGFACEDTTAFNYTRLLSTSVSDDDDRLASRVKLEAGMSYLTSFGVLNLNAFAQYDSAVAGVKNPVLTQDQFLGGDPTRPPPSHLVFDDAWSYGGKVMLIVPLQ